jgi:hypothetical protein
MSAEDAWKAARMLQDAADKAERAAYGVDSAVHDLKVMFEDGYGGNALRLIELLEKLELQEDGRPTTTSKSVGTLEVGKHEHGPFIFHESAYGLDNLRTGRHQLFLADKSNKAPSIPKGWTIEPSTIGDFDSVVFQHDKHGSLEAFDSVATSQAMKILYHFGKAMLAAREVQS